MQDVQRLKACDRAGHAALVGQKAPGIGANDHRYVPGADHAIDAADLPDDESRLAEVLEHNTVFGRVTPHQKRQMVGALQSRGHVVAMTGDGVNDVLALKDADIGIAMGSGSSASRAVAQLVLLDGRFDTLPSVVGEGRRVIANIERVANLFVTKTVYALVLAFAIGLAALPFPFVPRHLTLVGSITIGIPGFFLALAPIAPRARTGFLRRVLRFAIPTGIVAAGATWAAYELAIAENTNLTEARTTATIVLAAIGLFALAIVARPLDAAKKTLVGVMAAGMILVLADDWLREFYELDLPRIAVLMAAVGIVAVTGTIMYSTLHALGWLRHVPELLQAEEVDLSWRGARHALRRGYERTRDLLRGTPPGNGGPDGT